MATTSISLVREQSEAVNPPRALWVPFALGRPLGSAADPGFQTDVLRAAFAILETAESPTIVDYLVDAPMEAGPEAWACPVNLPVADDPSHTGRLLAEVARLRPWAAETRTVRGRTIFGVTGAGADQVDEVARALGGIADTGDLEAVPPGDVDWAFDMPLLVRHLAEDLRTFYHEAVAAQPGPNAPNHAALNDWIFGGTALGDTLQQVGHHLTAADDFILTMVRGLTIPEGRYDDPRDDADHWAAGSGV